MTLSGAFAVSRCDIGAGHDYIASQDEHRHKGTFQKEYLVFLEEQGTEYDPPYIW